MRWRPTDALTIHFGYAHLLSDDVPLDQDNDNAAASGRIVGQQASDIDIASAQLIYEF